MRTEDLNRYEALARKLSHGFEPDASEAKRVLAATDHTWDDLHQRARFLRDRRAQSVEPGALERYQDDARLWGVDEGLAIVVAPLLLFGAVAVGVVAALYR